jgi:hypothetical protein
MKKMSRTTKAICEFLLKFDFIWNACSFKTAWEEASKDSFSIGEHIIRLIIYEKNPMTETWIKDIDNWFLDAVLVYIGNGKCFAGDDYFEMMYAEPWENNDIFDKIINWIDNEHPDLKAYRKEISIEDISLKLKTTLKEMCQTVDKSKSIPYVDEILRTL